MQATDIMTIGQLSQRTGIAVSAIRYYEAQGLVSPMRSPSGHRRFRRADLRRLSFILIAQKFGFTLPEIRARLDLLPAGRTPNARDWVRISEVFAKRLDDEIATLTRMRETLNGCIGCGCLSLDKCQLYNAKDAAAQRGAGPRYALGDRPAVLE